MRVDACMRDHVMRDSCVRAFVYGGLVGPVAVPSVHSIGCDRVSQLRTLTVAIDPFLDVIFFRIYDHKKLAL